MQLVFALSEIAENQNLNHRRMVLHSERKGSGNIYYSPRILVGELACLAIPTHKREREGLHFEQCEANKAKEQARAASTLECQRCVLNLSFVCTTFGLSTAALGYVLSYCT